MSGYGERWLRRSLALLPEPMRRRFGAEIMATAAERAARAHGRTRRAGVWIGEIAGVAAAAMRARWPDGWTRRTAPARYVDAEIECNFDTERSIMTQLLTDLRSAVRALRRRPAVSGLAVGSIALGIGASVGMFSVVDSVLLRPYAFADPGALAAVYVTWPKLAGNPVLAEFAARGTFSWAEFWDVRARQRSFTDVGAYERSSAVIGGTSTPQELAVGVASPGLFQMLGVKPALGSLLPAAGGDAHLALLSHALWVERFGGRRAVVGETITLDDDPYRVIGVLPAGAEDGLTRAELWIPRPPLPGDAQQRNNHTGMRAIGRLRPGVTLEQARLDVQGILIALSPPGHGQHGAATYPLQADRLRTVRMPLVILLAAAGLLLLVGCTNVAAILLGAGLERSHEIAVRAALGASRARLVRQLLTESIVLAVAGGVAGVLLARASLRALVLLAPVGVPRIDEAAIDLRAVAVALGLAVLCGVLFGILPAFSLSRRSPATSLSSSRGAISGMARGQALVVVGELALATLLLVGGGLLARTLFALDHVDPGFRADQLVSLQLALPFQRFNQLSPDSARHAAVAYFDHVVESVRAVPGVTDVVVASTPPLLGGQANNDVKPDGADRPAAEGVTAERRFVSANYFQAMGSRIVQGRAFRPDDDETGAAPTMIISEGLARRFWPGQSAVGKRVSFWGRAPSTVVGVAADVRDLSLDSNTEFEFYVPFRQVGTEIGELIVRTTLPAASITESLRAAIHRADPAIAVSRLDPYRVVLSKQVAEQRFRARLMAAFAALAALFAGLGVYGVAARSVARRTREIGVRVALGAQPGRLFSQVVGGALRLSALGALLGLAIALAAGRSIERLLYGVRAADPLTIAAAAVAMLGVSVIASYYPGRRATRISPMEALRTE